MHTLDRCVEKAESYNFMSLTLYELIHTLYLHMLYKVGLNDFPMWFTEIYSTLYNTV